MKPRMVSHLFLLLIALLTAPAIASAQEATLTGTIVDSTGGVLPGVTVTAVHDATGNRFVAVTDERGIYRIPARVGVYQITAELPGFTTVTQSGVQLLIGQTAAMLNIGTHTPISTAISNRPCGPASRSASARQMKELKRNAICALAAWSRRSMCVRRPGMKGSA